MMKQFMKDWYENFELVKDKMFECKDKVVGIYEKSELAHSALKFLNVAYSAIPMAVSVCGLTFSKVTAPTGLFCTIMSTAQFCKFNESIERDEAMIPLRNRTITGSDADKYLFYDTLTAEQKEYFRMLFDENEKLMKECIDF